MSTYELKLHSRDLAIKGGSLVNHTGYDLIETKADGSIRFYKESNKWLKFWQNLYALSYSSFSF